MNWRKVLTPLHVAVLLAGFGLPARAAVSEVALRPASLPAAPSVAPAGAGPAAALSAPYSLLQSPIFSPQYEHAGAIFNGGLDLPASAASAEAAPAHSALQGILDFGAEAPAAAAIENVALAKDASEANFHQAAFGPASRSGQHAAHVDSYWRDIIVSKKDSPEHRRAVRELVRLRRPGVAVNEAVVVGAGPGGLMSAITLFKHGARVTLIEQRDTYNRPIHFNVRQSFLDEMAFLDPKLLKQVEAKVGLIERVEFVDATIKKKLENPPAGIRKAKAAERIVEPRQMMESPSVGQIRVSDLEKILYGYLKDIEKSDLKKGHEPRVRLVENAQADLEAEGGRYSVIMEKVETRKDKDGKSQRARSGEREYLGVPDLVVIAEGANSVTRAKLGVRPNPTSSETRFIAGYVDKKSGGLIRRRYDTLEDPKTGKEAGVRQIAVGHSKYAKTWTLVEVPEHVSFKSPKGIAQYYIRHAAKVLEIPVKEMKKLAIEWGPNLFRLQQWISDRATVGENVVLIGDSVGNAHFLTSGGVMTAAVPHQNALHQLLDGLAASETGARTRLLRTYEMRVRKATLEWMRLGIREFGNQVAAVNFGAQFNKLLADLRKAEGRQDKASDAPSAGPSFLKTSEAERALEAHPQGEGAWNKK